MCADRGRVFTVTLDDSERGYSWECCHEEDVPVEKRMMRLAERISKGALIGKLVSWRVDKIKLILWAEACVIAGRPLLMNEEALVKLSTLQIDNLADEDLKGYVKKGVMRKFIRTETRNRGIMAVWLGVFELFPGLYEASRRPTAHPGGFRALLPLLSHMRGDMADNKALMVFWQFGSMQGLKVFIKVDNEQKIVKEFEVNHFDALLLHRYGIPPLDSSDYACPPIEITLDEERQWSNGTV